jgi:hypothetical protein
MGDGRCSLTFPPHCVVSCLIAVLCELSTCTPTSPRRGVKQEHRLSWGSNAMSPHRPFITTQHTTERSHEWDSKSRKGSLPQTDASLWTGMYSARMSLCVYPDVSEYIWRLVHHDQENWYETTTGSRGVGHARRDTHREWCVTASDHTWITVDAYDI